MRFRHILVLMLMVMMACAASAQQRTFVIPASPIPADPLELATGATRNLDTPQERATVLGLLERARQNSDLWGPNKPYNVKISFQSGGSALYTGPGQLEQTWQSTNLWLYTASIGGFTQTRLFSGGRAYDQRSDSFVPLRLQMVRDVVFWPMNWAPRAMVRIAAGRLGQTDLMCALFSSGANDPAAMSAVPGRRWVETEYCVEPGSGLLRVYSEAPGIYAVYDYSNGLQIHGHVLPRNITVTEAGQTVLSVTLDSVSEPTQADLAKLAPSGALAAAGMGSPLAFPMRWPQFAQVPQGFKGAVHPVIVHAILGPDGRAVDQEPLQNDEPELTQAAMDVVRRASYPAANGRFARAQREVFINVKFMEPQTTATKP